MPSLIHAEREIHVDRKKKKPVLVRENQLDPTLTLSEEGEGLACRSGRGGSCPWTFLGVVKWSAERGKEREKLGRKNTKGYLLKGWREKRERGGWKKKRRQNDETARWMEKVWSLRGRRKEVTREGRRG